MVSIDGHQTTPFLPTSFPGAVLSPLEGGTETDSCFFLPSKCLNSSDIYGLSNRSCSQLTFSIIKQTCPLELCNLAELSNANQIIAFPK